MGQWHILSGNNEMADDHYLDVGVEFFIVNLFFD